jgi:hypothetical protein
LGMAMKRLLLLALLGSAWPDVSQAQAPPDAEQMVSVDPIRCWWRTSKGGVRIGETFDLTLTCAVLENEAVQVVPDESRLAGAVIAMAPYEVVASAHPADLRSGARRFFQYLYTMRIINPDAIGDDVPIPIMTLHYRVNSRVAANASLQGRDLTYVLPPQSVRVESMVTADAPDIRDGSTESFSTIEALTNRAGILEVASITLAALGVLMIIVVLVRLLAGIGRGETDGKRLMGDYSVLSHATRELSSVQRDAEGGWTPDLVARALAATRIAGASALGRPVSQREADRTEEAGAGRVMARGLFGWGKATALSGAATSEDFGRAAARLPDSADPGRRRSLEELQSALVTFDRELYGREASTDRSALDAALTSALSAARRLRSAQIWPMPQIRRLMRRRQTAVEQQA